MIGSMYHTKLESLGFEIFLADKGGEGLEMARKEMPELILLDVILPQLDGFSVLEELKKNPKTKNIPVIMLTNLGTEEDQAKGKKLGAVDYIVKASLTPSQVGEKVRQYLK